MNPFEERLNRLDDAIIVDEIGLESGSYGIYRLRCLYQPVFERRGPELNAVAVAGTTSAFLAGEEAPWDLFVSAVAEQDFDFIEEIGLALQLRNHANIAPDETGQPAGLELLLGVAPRGSGPESLADRVRLVAGELAEADIDPALVVCSIAETAAGSNEQLAGLADEIRAQGMRIAIADFGMGRWTDEQLALLDPEIVRIDGDWFRTVCRDTVTIRLFDSVMARLRERGAKVLAGGIETGQQLGVALRAGVHLFQGDHLAPPVHVGVAMPGSVSLRAKLGSEKLVSLYG